MISPNLDGIFILVDALAGASIDYNKAQNNVQISGWVSLSVERASYCLELRSRPPWQLVGSLDLRLAFILGAAVTGPLELLIFVFIY